MVKSLVEGCVLASCHWFLIWKDRVQKLLFGCLWERWLSWMIFVTLNHRKISIGVELLEDHIDVGFLFGLLVYGDFALFIFLALRRFVRFS